MRDIRRLTLIGAVVLLAAKPAYGAVVLSEYRFNIDSVVTANSAPAGVNIGAFNTTTGLGSISVTVDGNGPHYVGLFVNHDIDGSIADEVGNVTGAPAAGQSWEIDDPVLGNIGANFGVGALDNSLPAASPGNISMALASNFILGVGETAIIEFLVSETSPAGGFSLRQIDSASQASIYFTSSLAIGNTAVPEPATLALLGLSLAGLALSRRKRM